MLDLARSRGRVILDHEATTEHGEAWFAMLRPGGEEAVMVQEDRNAQLVRFRSLNGPATGYKPEVANALFCERWPRTAGTY